MAAQTQLYATSSLGGFFSVAKLSKIVRHQAQTLQKFRQFTQPMDEAGKNKGSTFYWDIVSNVATAGGTLVETSTVPITQVAITQGTGTLTEYGNKLNFTGKLRDLADMSVDNAFRTSLRNDMAKTLDKGAEAAFDLCKIRYVGTSTAGYAITTNGTATATCTSNLNKYHVQQIVNYMAGTMLAPPYEGDNYVCVSTVNAMYGLYSDLEAIMQYTKFPLTGEIGRYYDTRFIKETNAMSNGMGKSSAYGEAYFLGSETVNEGVAVPEEIRTEPPTDLGRIIPIGWYFLGGWGLWHAGNPDNRIVKFDSA